MTGRRPSFGRLLRGIAGEAVVTSAGERAQSLYSQPVGRSFSRHTASLDDEYRF